MASFDLPRDQLPTYQPARAEPPAFGGFWRTTLAGTRFQPLPARFGPVEAGLRTVATFAVTFAGFGRRPNHGWFLPPRHRAGPRPCLVEHSGRGGSHQVARQQRWPRRLWPEA
ncbi:MAG: acetylxylan esterase [Anaerolineales bacterium]|nr:acetylxylan esterase [Anaerolineales bacterium]